MSLKKLKTNKNDLFRFSIYGNPNEPQDKVQGNYFPLNVDSYITICTDNSYNLWEEVVEMILPILYHRKISIIAFSLKETASLKNCININNLKIRHAVDILEKSLLNLSGQDWSLTLSQNNNLEEFLFFQTSESEKVLFSNEKNCIIDLDKPEIMAERIFKNIGERPEGLLKTLFIGPSYGTKVLELIPNFELQGYPSVDEGTKIGIRCDLFENWEFVLKAAQFGLNPVVTCRSLPKKPVSGFLSNVSSINLYVNENTEIEDIKNIESLAIPYRLFSEDENDEKAKRKLFDFPDIKFIDNWGKKNLDKLSNLTENTQIRSRRLLVGNEGSFLSVYHWKNGLSVSDVGGNNLGNGILDDDFLKEADLFYYFNH